MCVCCDCETDHFQYHVIKILHATVQLATYTTKRNNTLTCIVIIMITDYDYNTLMRKMIIQLNMCMHALQNTD